MRAAIERANQHVVARIEEMPDVVRGGPAVFHAALQERELVAALARASLDGVLDDLPSGWPATVALLERFQSELEGGQTRGRHDPRVIVACLTSATMGYALFGPFVRRGVGLDGEPDESVEAAMVAVLQDVARLAFGELTEHRGRRRLISPPAGGTSAFLFRAIPRTGVRPEGFRFGRIADMQSRDATRRDSMSATRHLGTRS